MSVETSRRWKSVRDIECYESARFFTVTGDRVPGTPHDINERTAELADLHAEVYRPFDDVGEGDSSMTASVTPSMDDEDLLEKAMQAKNGPKFTRLWNGETGGYDSHSETDMALACLLAFWTQKMRPRWIVYSDNQGSIARSGTNHTIRVGRPTEGDGRTGSFGDE